MNRLDCDRAVVGHWGTPLGYAVGANGPRENESEVMILFLITVIRGQTLSKEISGDWNAIDIAKYHNGDAYKQMCHMFSFEVEERTRDYIPHRKKE